MSRVGDIDHACYIMAMADCVVNNNQHLYCTWDIGYPEVAILTTRAKSWQ